MDNDIELLDRYMAGDSAAFDELVKRHQRHLYSLIYRMVNDHDEAADLLQKTFVKAFLSVSGFERRSSFKTWLYQIAINLTKNFYRDKAAFERVSLDDVVIKKNPKTIDSMMERQERRMLRQAVAALPHKQRLTVILRIQESKKFEEIAEILNCSVGTAKANYHHAVEKLKKMMKGQE